MNDNQKRVARWLQDNEFKPIRSRCGEESSGRCDVTASPIENPANSRALQRYLAATPSRIGVGRSGTRYLTKMYLDMRADHAIAKDAVYSEIKDEFPKQIGCIALRTRCKGREDYLLFPNNGRRLDDESLANLSRDGDHGCDVQVIVGDGLSAWAAERNVPELMKCLDLDLKAAGFKVGRPVFVRFARVGVQDQIGVCLGAKATVIFVGERPGLGTGDSLSVYIAYGPRLDQDNAEKNCISNVRPLGILPAEASKQTVEILKRAFAAGKGGVAAT